MLITIKKPHKKRDFKKAVLYIFLTVLCIVVSRETIYNISIKFNCDRTKHGKVLLMKFYVITFDGEESQKTGYLNDYFQAVEIGRFLSGGDDFTVEEFEDESDYFRCRFGR